MKHLFSLLLLSLFVSSVSFAAETTTECPMMREQNERNNPKANLATTKPKIKRPSSQASAQ